MIRIDRFRISLHAVLIALTPSILPLDAWGQSQESTLPEQANEAPRITSEKMILRAPEKWYPYSKPDDAVVDTWFFPAGDDPSNWTETLRVQQFSQPSGVQSSSALFRMRSENARESCSEYESEILEDQLENGYPMTYWRQTCDSLSSPGEIATSLNKAIYAVDRLYVLSKVWKYRPDESAFSRWQGYFEDVYVCDSANPDHGCRPSGSEPMEASTLDDLLLGCNQRWGGEGVAGWWEPC